MTFEVDEQIRKFVNKNRLKFIKNLATDVFMDGFPGLTSRIRQNIRCVLEREGPEAANSRLLDEMLRVEDFVEKFINLCKKEEQCLELAHFLRSELERIHSELQRPRHDQIPCARPVNLSPRQPTAPPVLVIDGNKNNLNNLDKSAAAPIRVEDMDLTVSMSPSFVISNSELEDALRETIPPVNQNVDGEHQINSLKTDLLDQPPGRPESSDLIERNNLAQGTCVPTLGRFVDPMTPNIPPSGNQRQTDAARLTGVQCEEDIQLFNKNAQTTKVDGRPSCDLKGGGTIEKKSPKSFGQLLRERYGTDNANVNQSDERSHRTNVGEFRQTCRISETSNVKPLNISACSDDVPTEGEATKDKTVVYTDKNRYHLIGLSKDININEAPTEDGKSSLKENVQYYDIHKNFDNLYASEDTEKSNHLSSKEGKVLKDKLLTSFQPDSDTPGDNDSEDNCMKKSVSSNNKINPEAKHPVYFDQGPFADLINQSYHTEDDDSTTQVKQLYSNASDPDHSTVRDEDKETFTKLVMSTANSDSNQESDENSKGDIKVVAETHMYETGSIPASHIYTDNAGYTGETPLNQQRIQLNSYDNNISISYNDNQVTACEENDTFGVENTDSLTNCVETSSVQFRQDIGDEQDLSHDDTTQHSVDDNEIENVRSFWGNIYAWYRGRIDQIQGIIADYVWQNVNF